jgi:hypothetical protein
MVALVTFTEAAAQLRVTATDDDVDIYRKMDQASAIVVDYVTDEDKAVWTDLTVPPEVKAAVLLVLGELFDTREVKADPLSATVRNLLRRHRTPSLA